MIANRHTKLNIVQYGCTSVLFLRPFGVGVVQARRRPQTLFQVARRRQDRRGVDEEDGQKMTKPLSHTHPSFS
ncbi:hypothetical protein HanXRQr2_Chr05g0200061 [Helianthus annuus]|uniref:Uncharacterized protein n=1 Tax=Helianthus annuus TaxID=4232 RepID=A0A9K3IX74_HELAN|nr:hypothetical protein HanXRQr2_Chr05g0200061 [Helianthus annuus]